MKNLREVYKSDRNYKIKMLPFGNQTNETHSKGSIIMLNFENYFTKFIFLV
jgi:hypothetical protein